ncbi:MAG TPA: LacI family DNA-binding transcriptional regulator [Dermatophilaceae bacterium]|nr:LacI family DNA-binding transcriptional regulator [Dermatophilaceae bacterium]
MDAPAPRGRMSTITDVARVAGVSVATVSRALRGLDRVSADTRERVLRVAGELDYVASPTATSLASGRTQVVGVVAPFLTRWFFSELVSAIEKALRGRGHHVLLLDLEDESYTSRLPLSQNMLWKRVDGLITLNIPMSGEEVALVDRLGFPLVAVGTPVPGRTCVAIDDAAAIRTATEHLIGLGHSRIAYVGAVPRGAVHVLTPRTRLRSFEATMRAHGLATPAHWVRAADWTADAAAADACELLTGGDAPTAVVAASDELAFGVLAAARRAGVGVPRELSVVGVDDHYLSAVLGLTTVRQDVAAQGRRAAELLLAALEADEPPLACTELVPTELVVRESSGPAHG